MIGGKIISFTTKGEIVVFHVEEIESTSRCFVKAKMDRNAQKLIDVGAMIWWTSNEVLLSIGDVPDCKFQKIGFSY